MVTFTHHDLGTPERSWRAWLDDEPAAALGPFEPDRAVIVAAAHPDDETLGAGGLIATAAEAGCRVTLLVGTDGEGSHPRSPTTTPAALARFRSHELDRATALLAPGASLTSCHLPDGSLDRHVPELIGALTRLATPLGVHEPPLLVAPWRGDGHPDHEAVGTAAAAVAADLGLELLEYPIWAWHWAKPADARIPWQRLARLPLDDSLQDLKRRAVAEHRTQVAPLSPRDGDETLLGPHVLARFDRPFELFLRTVPRSLSAGYFTDLYARLGPDPWQLQDRWYEQRKRAVIMAALPSPRFRSAFEPGCATGLLTSLLAERCDKVLALDPVAAAVAQARERTRHQPGVDVALGGVPEDWPPAACFDLIVLSEVGYYLAGDDLARLARLCAASLTTGGVLVASHWRHPAADHPGTADEVHGALHDGGLAPLVHHVEDDFVLDVLAPPPARSVARAGGLVP